MEDKNRLFLDLVEEGKQSEVLLFLQNGSDPNAQRVETGDSALIIACEKGYTDIVKLLLSFNADASLCNITGSTALHSAVLRDHIEIIELLYNNGGVANLDTIDMHGMTALHLAVTKGYIRTTRMLLRYGADANICEHGFQRSPLQDAVRMADFRSAEFLLENNANVNHQDISGATALHEAVTDNNLHIARLLLKHGANTEVCEGIGGLTPMQAARSREMRQLLSLFARRASRESDRSVDSGAYSLHGSYDNMLNDSLSRHGSGESLLSLPAIKLNENIPYDLDTERRLIKRIRSRSRDRPVLVHFKERKSASLERDLNKIDVLDKTQYITRGRSHVPRKTASFSSYRARSLESVYNAKENSIRGYRFSWSPIRGRSRSNSYERNAPRQYKEPPLKLFQSKFPDWLLDREYMMPHTDPIEIRVVVKPENGATSKEGYESDDAESGLASTPVSTSQSPASSMNIPRPLSSSTPSTSKRASRVHPGSSFSSTSAEYLGASGGATAANLGASYPGTFGSIGQASNDYSRQGSKQQERLDSSSSSDDEQLNKYEEELRTQRRPVHIYSSIEDLSVVTPEGVALKEEEDAFHLETNGRHMGHVIEKKVTKLARRASKLDDSDRSFNADNSGRGFSSPPQSPVRKISNLSDVSSEASQSNGGASIRHPASEPAKDYVKVDSKSSSKSHGHSNQDVKSNSSNNDIHTEKATTHGAKQHTNTSTSKTANPSSSYSLETAKSNQGNDASSEPKHEPVVVRAASNLTVDPIQRTEPTITEQPKHDINQSQETLEVGNEDDDVMVDRSSYYGQTSQIRQNFEMSNRLSLLAGRMAQKASSIKEEQSSHGSKKALGTNGSSQIQGHNGEGTEVHMRAKGSTSELEKDEGVNDETKRSSLTVVLSSEASQDKPVKNENSQRSAESQNTKVKVDTKTEEQNRKMDGSQMNGADDTYRIQQRMVLQELQNQRSVYDMAASVSHAEREPIGSYAGQVQGHSGTASDIVISESDRESMLSPDEYADLNQSIRNQMQLESQLSPNTLRIKRGSITPVGAVVRKEFQMGRSDSELEEDKDQQGPSHGTYYDAQEPMKTSQQKRKSEEVQTEGKLSASDSGSSDTLANSDVEVTVQSKEVVTQGNGERFESESDESVENDYVNHAVVTQQLQPQRSLRDAMQNRSSPGYQLGMSPSSNYQARTFQTESDSELSDRHHGDHQKAATRTTRSSSPEPEWDRSYDDALLHQPQQQYKLNSSRQGSQKPKRKKSSRKSSKASKSGQSTDTTAEAHLQGDLEGSGSQDPINNGDQSQAYGAFDMYEKPPEEVKDDKEESFWNKVCGCCFNFGLF